MPDPAHLLTLEAPDPSWPGTGLLPRPPELEIIRYPMEAHPRVAAMLEVGAPAAVNWRPLIGSIMDQGQTPQCSAFSSASCKSLGERFEHGAWWVFNAPLLFTEGGGGPNGGVIEYMTNVIVTKGAARVDTGKRYLDASYASAPRDLSYRDVVKAAIAAQKPVVIALLLPQNWSDPSRTSDGAATGGYHALHACGYDDTWMYGANSWGAGWGDHGFFKITWAYFEANSFQQGYHYVVMPVDVIGEDGGPTPPPPATVTLVGHTLSPSSVASGGTILGTLTLSGPAPAGGVMVALTCTCGPWFASVPTSVSIPAGAASGQYTIQTTVQPAGTRTDATVIAALGAASLAANFSITSGVTPPPPKTLTVILSVAPDARTFSGLVSEPLAPASTIAVAVQDADGRKATATATVGGVTPPPLSGHIDSVTGEDGTVTVKAPPGEGVTIHGAGFGAAMGSLTIAGVPAPVVSSGSFWTDTAIKLSLPNTTAAVDPVGPIVVHTQDGRAITSTFQFTLWTSWKPSPPPGGPVLAAISPNHGRVGALVTAQGSGFDGTCFLIFSPGLRADVVSVNPTALACHVPAGATTGAAYISRHSDNTQSAGLLFTVDGGGGGTGKEIQVSPSGSDSGTGSAADPF